LISRRSGCFGGDRSKTPTELYVRILNILVSTQYEKPVITGVIKSEMGEIKEDRMYGRQQF
jgi:hypothetical protein